MGERVLLSISPTLYAIYYIYLHPRLRRSFYARMVSQGMSCW